MEENNENQEFKQEETPQEQMTQEPKEEKTNTAFEAHTEEMKKEAAKTVNEVKNTLKQADLKKDSKEATGFFTSFFKNPLQKIKEVAESSDNKFLKIAIVVLVVWIASILLQNVFSVASHYLFGVFGSFSNFFRHFFSNMLHFIKEFIAPIITVAILSGLIYGFQKGTKKSFLSVMISVVIAKIPVVIANVLFILNSFGTGVTKLTSPFAGFCGVLSTVLLYFVIKNYVEEKNDNFFWKFALVMGIFYVVKFVLSFLGIYL